MGRAFALYMADLGLIHTQHLIWSLVILEFTATSDLWAPPGITPQIKLYSL